MNRRRQCRDKQPINESKCAQVRHGALVRCRAKLCDAFAFFNLLTSVVLFDLVESLLPRYRERKFPPLETLSMFLAQVLSADSSCQRAVNARATKYAKAGMEVGSLSTAAYCRARGRLPLEMIERLARAVGSLLSEGLARQWTWRGRRVCLVDGTTVALADTEPNQAKYPQASTQKPGLGFPILRWVGLMCLGSGALLDLAKGPYQGKGADEQTLLRCVLHRLRAGDVLLGDAYFATYFLLCELRQRGVDALFEQHGARRSDFRRGTQLGPRDHLIVWHKPKIRPGWMSPEQFEQAPETLSVREVRVGGKTLITTFLDHQCVSKADLKHLYQQRWQVEVNLRHLKTTLGMDQLRCKTPQMLEKELWVYMLAYNLIRLLMAQAAPLKMRRPCELSFKHTVQLWLAWHEHGGGIAADEDPQILLRLIAESRVGHRPGRIEPRAIKRRPKSFPLLMRPRSQAREHIRVHGHP